MTEYEAEIIADMLENILDPNLIPRFVTKLNDFFPDVEWKYVREPKEHMPFIEVKKDEFLAAGQAPIHDLRRDFGCRAIHICFCRPPEKQYAKTGCTLCWNCAKILYLLLFWSASFIVSAQF